MQVTITANALKSMLTGFAKVMSSRNTIPVLAFAQVAKSAAGVTFTVTNLDESLAYTLPPETQAPGTGAGVFLCSVEELKKAVVGLKKEDTLTLVPVGDESVRITTTTGGHALNREIGSLAASEFPGTSLGNTELMPCDTAKFLAAYKTALSAASKDEHRRVLCSVFTDVAESAMVGTDGRRMMRAAVENLPLKQELLLPATKVLANGILGVAEGFIGGQVTNTGRTLLEIRGGPWHYCARCVEGAYPNYTQVIPHDSTRETVFQFAEADVPLLKTAIRQLTSPENGSIAILAHEEAIVLLAGKPESDGEFPHIRLPNSKASSGHVLQTLNAEFVLDAINAGYFHVRAEPGRVPLKFRPTPDAGTSVYVLMPMDSVTNGMLAYAHKLFPSSFPAGKVEPVPASETSADSDPSAETNNEETETMKTKTEVPQEPETTAEVTAAESAEADANTAAAVVPPAVMQFPASADPIQDLLTELNTIQDSANEVLNRLRGLRVKARNVERHYRGKAKEIEAKSQLIAKFQKAVSL